MNNAGKRMLAVVLAVIMTFTVVSVGTLPTAYAAPMAPQVTYTFDEIKAISNIPVMNVTMKDPGEYDALKSVKDKRDIASFELVNTNGKGKDISLEAVVEDDGSVTYPLTLKGRGNSSWTMATGKKPYNIKFEKKQDLLGMGKSKSWCLISNWVDTTFIRNYMAYHLAAALGMGTPDSEMVALCVNGQFEGIYLLTEKVGLNEFRTETAGDGYDVNGDGIVTDSIVESDSRGYFNNEPGVFTTENGVFFVPKDPEEPDLAASEYNEIVKEVNAMEQAVMTGTDYEKHIDVDSWVDTYIINELAKNPDFGYGYQPCYSSSYLYFQEGGKVYAGPVWDFDIAYGRNNYKNFDAEGNRDTMGTTGFLTNATKYYKELFENTDFQERVMKRWQEIRKEIIPTWANETFMSGYEASKVLADYDFAVWGDYPTRIAGTYQVGRDTLDFEGETAYIKNFINERIAWLDTQWNTDDIEKKYTGTWNRWDVADAGAYASFEELKAAAEAGKIRTHADDVWDGGNGGAEKQGTEEIIIGSLQTSIPSVKLENPVTLTMEPQKKKNSWDNNYSLVSNVYEWWKDGEGKSGIGSKKDLSLTVTESGRYIGITSQKWYIGGGTTVNTGNETQVYVVDVGTDGSVTIHDGNATVAEAYRTVTVADTNYSSIVAKDGGYTISFKENQDGNCGTTLGGSGDREFGIYIPTDDGEASEITLKLVQRNPESIYSDVLLSREAAYIYAKGEKPAEWSVEGDAVSFDEKSGKITAAKTGTAVITAKTADGISSSVKVTCTETVADRVEYAVDPTLGKYYGADGTLKATKEERGTWATRKENTLTRFSYTFPLTANEAKNAQNFIWKTKEGFELLGGAADYYIFVNGKPVFAATADKLDYSIAGFDASNTAMIKADSTDYKGIYAYMKGVSGSTAGMMNDVPALLKAGNNTIDIFVSGNDGSAFVKPYFSGMNKIDTDTSEPVEIPVESVTLNKTEVTLAKAGETVQLTATVLPSNATDKTVTWSTGDKAVATVKDGLVTAVAEGKTTITAQAGDITAQAVITVLKEEVEITVENVVINDGAENVTLTEGEAVTLNAAVTPAGVKDATVTWSSADSSIASVDANGKVTANKAGTVEIKAVSNADNTKFDTITVIVEEKIIPVTGVTINNGAENVSLTEGEAVTLNAAVTPAGVKDATVTWSSADSSIASVDANGKVTANKAGTVEIKAVSNADKSKFDTITVIVEEKIIPVTGVTINDGAENVTLTEGEAVTLNAAVTPAGVKDATVTWSSADSSIASVDANGKVTANKAGTVEIKAVSNADKSKFDTITVIVEEKIIPVTDVTINDGAEKITVTEGQVAFLKATVNPTGVKDATVTWSSADDSIATVDMNGKLTAYKAGTVEIKAVSNADNTKFDTITVVVEKKVIPVTGVTINGGAERITLEEEQSAVLTVVVTPANADNKSVTWKTSDSKVVTVNASGEITAVAEGTAIITVTSAENNAITDTIEVVVNKKEEIPEDIKVTAVAFEKDELTLYEGQTGENKAFVIPDDATNKEVTYRVEDEKIAVVSADGKISTKAVGSTKVYAYAKEDNTIFASYVLTVNKANVAIVIPDGNVAIEDLSSIALTAKVTPEYVPNRQVIWSSSDETIAVVDANGVVTAKKPGVVNITATSKYDEARHAQIQLTVTTTKVNVAANIPGAVEEESSVTLEAQVSPAIYDMGVIWSVKNGTGEATLDGNVLTGVKAGTVTVTVASSYDPSVTVSKQVTVTARKIPVTGITVSEDELTLEEFAEAVVTAQVLPANASNQNVSWSTSNASVATVRNGVITAKAPGTAVITVKTAEGGFTKKINVTVTKMNFELTVAGGADKINVADQGSAQVSVIFTPNNVPNKSLTWKTSDASVVTVTGNGVLNAKKPGTAVVTATSVYDKTKTVSVTVTVERIPVTVEITGSTYTTMGNAIPMSAKVSPSVYDTTVTWTVTDGVDGGKAHFDADGKLVPDAVGHVTVTAVSNYDSQYAASIEVEIGEKAAGITVYAPVYDKNQATYPAGAIVYNPADGNYYVYSNSWGLAYNNTGAFPGYGWTKVNMDLSKPMTAQSGYNFGIGDIVMKGDMYYTPLGSGYWDIWIAANANNAYWNVIPKEYSQYIGVGFNYAE